ncbi:MAG: hypothetical protein KFF77_12430 [Bacteroidetes bacterium]|nr:hypothetical protein [Bacteroidota bacterium]
MRKSLGLGTWLDSPGHGRVAAVITARNLVWALPVRNSDGKLLGHTPSRTHP